MGLRDKIRGAWRRVSDLDDEGAPASGQDREKEKIPYKDISKKLKEVMKSNVDVVGRKIIIPGYYAIYLNEAERKSRREVENVLCDELKEELYHEMRKINPEQNKRDLVVEMQTDTSLEDGEFRIGHHITRPQSEPPVQPAPTPSQSEMDLQKTIVEQPPRKPVDDEQKTVVQKPARDVLYRLEVRSGDDLQVIKITDDSITAGRGSKDDVKLESPDFSISRSHVKIMVREGGYFILPSGINGTYVNGREMELNREAKINPGDEIRIMDYTLKIKEN